MNIDAQSIVIQVEDLSKDYTDISAVNSLNFNVFEGEVFGLLGPNGAGKTTLVEMLAGLIIPSSGSARVLGFDLYGDLFKLKSQIGIQLQSSSYHQYLTLKEILELFAFWKFWKFWKFLNCLHFRNWGIVVSCFLT